MEILRIDEELLLGLIERASASERLRVNFDLRTTSGDTSQRMLNALQPGTVVPIHKHESTAETTVCLRGRLDIVFYEKTSDGFVEVLRTLLCPRKGIFGVQIPQGTFHSVEVKEPSVIFEAKDGAYQP